MGRTGNGRAAGRDLALPVLPDGLCVNSNLHALLHGSSMPQPRQAINRWSLILTLVLPLIQAAHVQWDPEQIPQRHGYSTLVTDPRGGVRRTAPSQCGIESHDRLRLI